MVNTHDLEMIPNMTRLAKLCSTVVIIKETVPFSEVRLWKGLPKELLLKFNHTSGNILMHMDSTICKHIGHFHIVYQNACQVYFASHLSTRPHYTSTAGPPLDAIIMKAVASGVEVMHYASDIDHVDSDAVKVLNKFIRMLPTRNC